MKEVVIAGYDKSLDWIKKFNSDVKVTIYRKGELISYENEIFYPINVGRDVHTFFSHILNNYDNLSDYTFFVQDYPFDHWENLIEIINENEEIFSKKATLTFGGYYGFHFNTIGTMWQMSRTSHFEKGNIIWCHSNGEPQDTVNNVNVDSFWEILFDSPKPNIYEFVPGGHFGISKEQVHLRKKEFYNKIVELLENDIYAPWKIERLEAYIFNPKYVTKFQ
jgi:hypothetical protein